MKYYTYVSNSKIDMLFPQIPRKFLEDISGELSVNLGVLKATLKDKDLTETRLSKLHAVEKYIRKSSEVGDITDEKPYINGVLGMRSLIVDNKMALFCRAGKLGKGDTTTYLLLSGSAKHLIGMEDSEKIYSNSITSAIIENLSHVYEMQHKIEANPNFFEETIKKTNKEDEYLGVVRTWATYNKGPLQKFEFLARTLVVGTMENEKIILASPIYVAMAD